MIPKFLATVTAKAIALALLVIFVLAAVTLGPAACNRIRGLEAQTKVDQGQSNAFHASAGDAVSTVSNVATNQAASEDLTRRNTEEITHAKGADTRLDPELNAAFVRAACRRASAAHDPKCGLQHIDPGGVAGRR